MAPGEEPTSESDGLWAFRRWLTTAEMLELYSRSWSDDAVAMLDSHPVSKREALLGFDAALEGAERTGYILVVPSEQVTTYQRAFPGVRVIPLCETYLDSTEVHLYRIARPEPPKVTPDGFRGAKKQPWYRQGQRQLNGRR